MEHIPAQRRIAATTGNDRDREYPQAQGALWLKRLLGHPGLDYDDDFFSCVGWCCGGLQWAVLWLQHVTAEKKDALAASSKFKKAVRLLSERPSRSLPRDLQCIVDDFPDILPRFLDQITAHLEKRGRAGAALPSIIRATQNFFGLDKEAVKICTFAFLAHNYPNLEHYFSSQLDIEEYGHRQLFAKILDMPPALCTRWIARLLDMGILDGDYGIRLTCHVQEIWRNGNEEELEKHFCPTLEASPLPLAACNVKAVDREYVLRLLRHGDPSPKHILLYGPPGTGKTTFARSLARELGVKAWCVPCKDDDTPMDRRASLTACVRVAGRHKGAFVLVDEAETLLDTNMGMRGESASPKAWLNAFLEQKQLRVIWITNEVEHLDQAVRRRFSYSIYFPELGRNERRSLWRSIAKRLRVSSRLSDEHITSLAERYPVQVAVMEHVLRQARHIASKEDFVPCLEQLLKAHLTLQNDGHLPPLTKHAADFFDSCAICTERPADRLVETCRRLDARMRLNASDIRPGMGTMLFYGPPGTGKTALAQHLGHVLGRPCLTKHASDLLSGLVGATEAHIAAAFAEAQNDGAILVIDEADSFLQTREGAHHSWEVTQVNEFLTQLEQCRTFCICTTNFQKLLDAAAMRRFSFKVAFTYARPPQLLALYTALLAPLATGETPPAVLETLRRQAALTPGDFAAVQRQFCLEEPGTVAHTSLLDALLREQSLKREACAHTIGF